ncbi:17.5 kDa class I heat shock protein-like [Benincasa hispida]|uniref:17.5 kDa class I heat shock protein-like n=1 Tax=Benincasa hispida TaxID=102211 RepID=UPI0019018C52|nr:17.5 kDa class I heat shock protein-like [Benincasa hispida]
MSIIPIAGQDGRISSTSPSNILNRFPNFPFPLDLWHGFPFPSSISDPFSWGGNVNTHLDWTETPNAHVVRASLPGFGSEDVLVELQDDRMLQISTESGGFVSRFKIPESGKIEELSAFMDFGILTVFVPKEEDDRSRRDVRVVEITGE